jgi:hypothetical protein
MIGKSSGVSLVAGGLKYSYVWAQYIGKSQGMPDYKVMI